MTQAAAEATTGKAAALTASSVAPDRPVRYERETPDIMQALAAAQAAIAGHGLAPGLRHLVHLRASQINGCAHCIRMHTRAARDGGETDARLDYLVAWRQMPEYDAAERAALAWTEALTRLESGHADFAALRAQLRQHYSEEQISALTGEVAMINLWNRVAISGH